MKMNILLLLITTVVQNVASFNILGIFPYQGKSHFLVFRVQLLELARRGHNVTVISHFPEDNPPENYHDISLAGSIKIFADDVPMERSLKAFYNIFEYLMTIGNLNCEVLLANKQVQQLLKDKPKFDVVLLEQFNTDCALAIAFKLNAPVVGTSSSVIMPFHYPRLGIPYNPSYVSQHFLEGGTMPTFYQRLERTVLEIIIKLRYFCYAQDTDQKIVAKYIDDVPPLEELAKNIKLWLVYTHPILTGSRLFPAHVIEIGGYHVPPTKQLTAELKKFVEGAEHGVVYISFGSVVKSSTMPEDRRKMILEAMNEFPQRFIWKWEDKTLSVDKNKLYIDSWLPQVDILGHPKTLAFFSHAGLGGTTEAIHFGVPMIAMPIMGDQPSNTAAIAESGLGVELQLRDLTKENLVAALRRVLDPGFRKQVKDLSSAWHDRPMSPIDTAIFWTEYVARHPSIELRTRSADVPLYQYYCLDVISFFIAILLFTFLGLKCMCCESRRVEKTSKRSVNEKKKIKAN